MLHVCVEASDLRRALRRHLALAAVSQECRVQLRRRQGHDLELRSSHCGLYLCTSIHCERHAGSGRAMADVRALQALLCDPQLDVDGRIALAVQGASLQFAWQHEVIQRGQTLRQQQARLLDQPSSQGLQGWVFKALLPRQGLEVSAQTLRAALALLVPQLIHPQRLPPGPEYQIFTALELRTDLHGVQLMCGDLQGGLSLAVMPARVTHPGWLWLCPGSILRGLSLVADAEDQRCALDLGRGLVRIRGENWTLIDRSTPLSPAQWQRFLPAAGSVSPGTLVDGQALHRLCLQASADLGAECTVLLEGRRSSLVLGHERWRLVLPAYGLESGQLPVFEPRQFALYLKLNELTRRVGGCAGPPRPDPGVKPQAAGRRLLPWGTLAVAAAGSRLMLSTARGPLRQSLLAGRAV